MFTFKLKSDGFIIFKEDSNYFFVQFYEHHRYQLTSMEYGDKNITEKNPIDHLIKYLKNGGMSEDARKTILNYHNGYLKLPDVCLKLKDPEFKHVL